MEYINKLLSSVKSGSCREFDSKKHEKTILWNDKKLSIPWNIENNKAIISKKDKNGILFKVFKSPY